MTDCSLMSELLHFGQLLLGTEPVITHAEEMFRLVRYAISRNRFSFSSEPVRGMSSGYMALYNYSMWHTGQDRIAALEREFFHSEMRCRRE